MPQRILGAWWILVGGLGVVAVGLWALCGRDVRAAALRGGRVKRMLLAAGLSVLAVFGWTPSRAEARAPAADAPARAEPADEAFDASEAVLAVFRMRMQLGELEKLTATRDVNGPAVTAAADAIDSLAAVLRKAGNVARLTPKGQAEAARLLALAETRVPIARALVPVGTTDLARSPQWQIVVDAWRHAGPLATSGKSTIAQRKAADAKFKAAATATAALAQAGLLSAAEAGLLSIDAARLRTEIYRNPPTDSRVRCYEMMFIPPAQSSLKRLEKQATLLKTILAARTLAPAALDKVVGAIERDLAILADPKQTRHLAGNQKQTAEALRKQVASLVAQIKDRVRAGRVSRLSERLGQAAGWVKVKEAMTFGAKIGSSHTMAQRVDFLRKYISAASALAALARAGTITQGESAFVKGELDRIRGEVRRKPPTDIGDLLDKHRPQPTCYMPLLREKASAPGRQGFMPIKERAAVLKRLAESGRLTPAVLAAVEKQLDSTEADA